jgi:uncharacterized protein (TIGR04255 family)
MARPRFHLRHAPIAEAVIDFRVLNREGILPVSFENLGSLIGVRYAKRSAMNSLQARFGFDGGKLIDSERIQSVVGWMYQTEAEIAQFRLDGFTFSKIEPYTTWEEVFQEAIRLWRIYAEAASPRQVSRVAVRYINRMKLAGPVDLREYLVAPPVLPAPIPQAVREFLTRVYVDDVSRGASAVLVQALEPPVDPAVVSLILDIDAFCEVSASPEDPALPQVFEQLRQLKNDIFFASITEKAAEMYE